MMDRTYDEIMRDIESGLSGDPKEDAEYLKEMAEVWKDHEEAERIHRAIARLLYGLLPQEGQAKFAADTGKERKDIMERLENVRFLMFRKKYDEALKEMETLVEMAEHSLYADEDAAMYFSFDEAFEEVLYIAVHEPVKEIHRAAIPMSRIYGTYGILLVELGRVAEAQKALEKGLRWNPIDCEIRAEYAETFKMQKDYERYLDEVLASFPYIFRPKFLARAYRDIGYYFIENKKYSEATFLYWLSMRYEPDSRTAQAELYYIEQIAEEEVKQLSVNEVQALSETYEFPLGADHRMLSLAYQMGKHRLETHQPGAEYFLNIAYDFTHDEEIKQMLDSIVKPA
ncbi:MAG: hypothetical protein K6E41_08240 [Solobacterium sp.]|nr:hypothetical protein [Solobacterium sp.]